MACNKDIDLPETQRSPAPTFWQSTPLSIIMHTPRRLRAVAWISRAVSATGHDRLIFGRVRYTVRPVAQPKIERAIRRACYRSRHILTFREDFDLLRTRLFETIKNEQQFTTPTDPNDQSPGKSK